MHVNYYYSNISLHDLFNNRITKDDHVVMLETITNNILLTVIISMRNILVN